MGLGTRHKKQSSITWWESNTRNTPRDIFGLMKIKPKLMVTLYLPFWFILLWLQSHGVSRERACPPDILKAKPQEHNTLKTDTTTSVWRCSPAECIDIVFQARRIWVNLHRPHALREKFGVVYTLRTREDFFTSHKEICRLNRI